MRRSPAAALLLIALLAVALLLGVWRAWSNRRATQGDEVVLIPFERVDQTVTVPPDHNARVVYHIEPTFRVRRRNEEEAKRRITFHRPRLMDALQSLLARTHYKVVRRMHEEGDGLDLLARQVRDEVNAVLGGPIVEEVQLRPPQQ